MLRNFRRLLCLFVDISITPLTRRKVESKFSARVRDPSRALRDFMRLSGHFPLESLTSLLFPLSRAALAWLLATPSSLRGSPPFGRAWDVFPRLPLERWLFSLEWRACWQARILFLSVKLSSWGWNLKCLLCLVFLQNIPKTTFSRYYYFQRD